MNRWGIIALLGASMGAAAAVFLARSYVDTIQAYDVQTVTVASPIENPAHAGEMVAERQLIQEIDWSRLKPWVLASSAEDRICVSLYMGTWGKRRNRGSLAVSLEGHRVAEEVLFNVAGTQDNRFHSVCFVEVTLGDVALQPARLKIRGVDGERGRSVTFWLSGHEGAASALIDGERAGRALVYDIQVVSDNPRERLAGWVLIGFFSLMVAVLILAAFERRLP